MLLRYIYSNNKGSSSTSVSPSNFLTDGHLHNDYRPQNIPLGCGFTPQKNPRDQIIRNLCVPCNHVKQGNPSVLLFQTSMVSTDLCTICLRVQFMKTTWESVCTCMWSTNYWVRKLIIDMGDLNWNHCIDHCWILMKVTWIKSTDMNAACLSITQQLMGMHICLQLHCDHCYDHEVSSCELWHVGLPMSFDYW